ncbi:hypothetical protein UAS_00702 [Enterococcus asini ATCC 700915]|uniref:Uncharacterized protein n=1 Tax=Enterococcus asini ATCC 700915 TaxID=1158606 RepID=R2Q1B9_9ENTE|nr:hypothetical protein [Enterococcus asini]EOH89163.1 hypothetical protein UAS_00702 [Enterococcus asini ATCC 700915]EOT55734.1 hypothetical protein I579_02097 [Enterococcus asini ATCC 700915]
MTAKAGRCIGWLLGTLIILVPVLLLLLVAVLAFKLIAATLGITALSLVIVFIFIMWLLVKAGAIIQKS